MLEFSPALSLSHPTEYFISQQHQTQSNLNTSTNIVGGLRYQQREPVKAGHLRYMKTIIIMPRPHRVEA